MINKLRSLITILLATSACTIVVFQYGGVFKYSQKYNNVKNNYPKETIIIMKDGTKINFTYLGRNCGGGIGFAGIIFPIIPGYGKNKCEKIGFTVSDSKYLATLGVSLQLRYNSVTYDPYIENGSVKFRIPDFSAFKKADDKTLIIHKKKPDGSLFTKELPFDWKIVVETSGGL